MTFQLFNAYYENSLMMNWVQQLMYLYDFTKIHYSYK